MPIGLQFLLQVIENDLVETVSSTTKEQSVSQIKCGNKLCTNTRQKGASEDGWSKRKIAENYSWLCERCSTAFVNKQYCEYCKQLYLEKADKGAVVDGLDWIGCESCNRWNHVECEAKNGNSDIKELMQNPSYPYYCAECEKVSSLSKKKRKSKVAQR